MSGIQKEVDLKKKNMSVALLFNVLLSHPIKVLRAYRISSKKTLPRNVPAF